MVGQAWRAARLGQREREEGVSETEKREREREGEREGERESVRVTERCGKEDSHWQGVPPAGHNHHVRTCKRTNFMVVGMQSCASHTWMRTRRISTSPSMAAICKAVVPSASPLSASCTPPSSSRRNTA